MTGTYRYMVDGPRAEGVQISVCTTVSASRLTSFDRVATLILFSRLGAKTSEKDSEGVCTIIFVESELSPLLRHGD